MAPDRNPIETMPKVMSKSGKAAPKRKALATVKTDIFISIKAPYMNNIVSKVKNHEFRKYLISETVERMWLYVSSPDQTLRYVATVSKGKSPGKIEEDGIGNADFNNGSAKDVAKFAYKILHLYKLRVPLPITELREKYNLTPPQRYGYLPQQLFEDVSWEQQEQLF